MSSKLIANRMSLLWETLDRIVFCERSRRINVGK